MKILFTLLALCFALNSNAATYLLLSQTNAFAKGITNEAKAYTDAHAGGGNVTNTGTSVVGNIPRYTDTTGTQIEPTDSISLQSVDAGLVTVSNITANSWAYFDADKILTNAPYVPQPTNAILTKLGTNDTTGTGTIVLTSVADAKANAANAALTGTPTINGQSVETQLTNKLDKTQGGNVAGTVRLTGTSSLLAPSTMTTAQKNALTPQGGDMVYDSDIGRAQVYDGAAWHSRMRLDGDTSTTGAAFTLGSVVLTNNPTTTVPLQINATNGTSTNLFEVNNGGTNRLKVSSGGVLTPGANNTIDIGTSGARFHDIFIGNEANTDFGLKVNNGNGWMYWLSGPFLTKSGNSTLSVGEVNSASTTDQTIQVAASAGTDKKGAGMTLAAGKSTGTGAGGYFDISTALSDELSGSTVNAYSVRYHAKGKYVALTHATTNAIIKFSLPANKLRGGSITALCYATNSTPHLQALTSEIQFAAVAVGTTITGTISQVDNPLAADSGTLTCAYTLVDNGDNTFYISANPNSSLSSPTERCKLVVTGMNGNAATTITDP